MNDVDSLAQFSYEATIIALILSIIIFGIGFILSWYFSSRQIKEKKRDAMFSWVHNELSTKVYIPLNAWIQTLCTTISWEDDEIEYKSYFFLYTLSKFFKYRYMNRQIVGDDIFFSASTSSNRDLSKLMDLIVLEISHLFEMNFPDEKKTERRFINTQFLAKLGESSNYMEFMIILKGGKLYNAQLSKEIEKLKIDLYNRDLLYSYPDQINFYFNSVMNIFREDIKCIYIKTKIKAYGTLFYHLMNLELFNMYDSWYNKKYSWYNEKDNIIDPEKLSKIKRSVFNIIKMTDKEIENYNYIINKYGELPNNTLDIKILKQTVLDIDNDINTEQDNGKKDNLIAKREHIKAEINRRNIVINIKSINDYLSKIDRDH